MYINYDKQNLVSVIIVTFNAAKILNNAIQSVLNQTYENVECLIIDGASTDGTVDIIKKHNVDYISEPDNGIFDAMNKGWKMAKGEWILYLGADDELLPDGIEALVKDCAGYDIVYGNTILKYSSGQTKKQYSKEINKIITGMVSCHQSLMTKKNVFIALGGFDTKYELLADYDLVLRAHISSFRFKQICDFVSIFSLNRTGCRNINKIIVENYKIIKRNKSVSISCLYIITAYLFARYYIRYIKRKILQ
jgi:glycosyltransferase